MKIFHRSSANLLDLLYLLTLITVIIFFISCQHPTSGQAQYQNLNKRNTSLKAEITKEFSTSINHVVS